MARSRNLKPGFFTNEELVECGFPAMILFCGLWTIADREGRLEDRSRRIKAAIFPYSPKVNVDRLLTALADKGFIRRYEVNGSKYIDIPAWHRHQNPHVKEQPSTIPAPCKPGASTVLVPAEHGACTGKSGTSRASSSTPLPALLFQHTVAPVMSGAEPETPPDANPLYAAYEQFVAQWPNPVQVDYGCQIWQQYCDDGTITVATVAELFAGLERWRKSEMWAEGKQHSVSTWLSKKLWLDHPKPAPRDPGDLPEYREHVRKAADGAVVSLRVERKHRRTA